MSENTMSFNKRICAVKKEVFEFLKDTKELEALKGTNTTGYYSLATIEKYLHPALYAYDLDLDLEVHADKIVGHWYDCISDKERTIEVDFSRIVNVGRLQLMANEVMSDGAVKSYTKRYAYGVILRLPSTDMIENQTPSTPQKSPTPQKAPTPSTPQKSIYINQKQISLVKIKQKLAGLNDETFKKYLNDRFKIGSCKFLTNEMLEVVLKKLNKTIDNQKNNPQAATNNPQDTNKNKSTE